MPLSRSRLLLLLFIASTLTHSCSKNSGGASGSRAGLAVVNLVVNGQPVDVSIDGNRVTPAPVAFGTSTQFNSGIYLQVGAGIHSIQAVSGTHTVMNNTVDFQAGNKYSLLLYDTLKHNDSIKTLLLLDDIVPVDTIAKARYFRFIPGKDTLAAILFKDTVVTAYASAYVGNQAAVSEAFTTSLHEGTYRLSLQRNNSVIFQQNTFPVVRGKLYTFIAKGIINGTGNNAESLLVLQHN